MSVVDKIGTSIFKDAGIDLVKVPACNTCNTRLSDRSLNTIGERLLHLYDHYTRLLTKKVLWSQAEINELEGNLKQLVQSSQNKIRYDVVERLECVERSLLDKKKTEY